MTTLEPSIERETVRSLITVLTHLTQTERNANHTAILSAVITRVWECYDEPRFDVTANSVTPGDVERAYTFLETHAPTRDEAERYRTEHGKPHPNSPFSNGLDFVDTASRYYTGCLPSFRTWTAKYLHDGAVIAERTYDYEDSIKLTPVIDDVRYRATSTKRDEDGTVRVEVAEQPFRTNIDVFIHQQTDQTVAITGHNGPNVAAETQPAGTLEAEFDDARRDGTGVIVSEELDDVVEFVAEQGWEYEVDDDVQLSK